MTVFQGWMVPQDVGETVVTGDTWQRGTTGIEFTWDGDRWRATAPSDAFAAILPAGGDTDMHLAKASARAYHGRWVESTAGILAVHTQLAAGAVWDVVHNLRQRYVAVTVVPAIDGTWYAEAGTVIVPEVDFRTINRCYLHFAYPLLGTALIRR